MPNLEPFAAAHAELKRAGASLTISDWSSIYMMMEKLNGKADELKKFSGDPKAYCADNGFPLPDGVGIISYADPQGLSYINPESEKPTASGVRVIAEIHSVHGRSLTCIVCAACV
jgi:hypothetical protein